MNEHDVFVFVSVTPAELSVRLEFRGKWPVVVSLGHHIGLCDTKRLVILVSINRRRKNRGSS